MASIMVSRMNKATSRRIFIAWVVFMEVILSRLNLKPDYGFLSYNMPEYIFIKIKQNLIDIIID